MTPWLEQAMREMEDLKKYNGAGCNDKTLPLSATYIISQDQKIA